MMNRETTHRITEYSSRFLNDLKSFLFLLQISAPVNKSKPPQFYSSPLLFLMLKHNTHSPSVVIVLIVLTLSLYFALLILLAIFSYEVDFSKIYRSPVLDTKFLPKLSRQMIQLPLVGGRVLVFDIDDARKLRLLGICGVLNGTLPAAPQQNVFLGLPLQLMPEDVIWLIEKGHAEVIDGLSSVQIDKNDIEGWNNSHLINIRDDLQEEILIAKLRKLSLPEEILTPRINAIKAAGDKKNFTVIPNSGPRSNEPRKFDLSTVLNKLPLTDPKRYHVYRYLRDQGIYILPGLRFGGDFLGYPNDPLRYHAHYVVNSNNKFPLLEIIAGGRLATGVKKVWVIVAEKSDPIKSDRERELKGQPDLESEIKRLPEISSYSIEWAGFG